MIKSMSAHVQPLEYATTYPILDGQARRVFGQLLALSILSGLCVGVCFLAIMWGIVGSILHVGVFAVTIGLAISTGMGVNGLSSIGEQGRPARMMLDLLAGIGLAGIGVAPVVYYAMEGTGAIQGVETLGAGALGIAYGLLAATTWRHRMLYRHLAELCRNSGHPSMATRLSRLGWGKTVYEGLWLGCCSMTLLLVGAHGVTRSSGFQDVALFFAFASLFGVMGFGGIWIWMIVVHAVLYRLARPEWR